MEAGWLNPERNRQRKPIRHYYRVVLLCPAGVDVPGGAAAPADQWAQVTAGDGGQHSGWCPVQAQRVGCEAATGEGEATRIEWHVLLQRHRAQLLLYFESVHQHTALQLTRPFNKA